MTTIAITCPKCGSDTEEVASGARHTLKSMERKSVVKCSKLECGLTFLLNMWITPANGAAQAVAQCGTEGGYRKHRRLKEETCQECRAAHARQEARMSGNRRLRAVK